MNLKFDRLLPQLQLAAFARLAKGRPVRTSGETSMLIAPLLHAFSSAITGVKINTTLDFTLAANGGYMGEASTPLACTQVVRKQAIALSMIRPPGGGSLFVRQDLELHASLTATGGLGNYNAICAAPTAGFGSIGGSQSPFFLTNLTARGFMTRHKSAKKPDDWLNIEGSTARCYCTEALPQYSNCSVYVDVQNLCSGDMQIQVNYTTPVTVR